MCTQVEYSTINRVHQTSLYCTVLYRGARDLEFRSVRFAYQISQSNYPHSSNARFLLHRAAHSFEDKIIRRIPLCAAAALLKCFTRGLCVCNLNVTMFIYIYIYMRDGMGWDVCYGSSLLPTNHSLTSPSPCRRLHLQSGASRAHNHSKSS